MLRCRQRNVTGICALSRFYSAQSGSLLSTFRIHLYVPSSRTAWLLEVRSRDCPETSVGNYNITLCVHFQKTTELIHTAPKAPNHSQKCHSLRQQSGKYECMYFATQQRNICNFFIGEMAWFQIVLKPACEVYIPNKIWGSYSCKHEHYFRLVYDIVQFGTHVPKSQEEPHQRGLKPRIH